MFSSLPEATVDSLLQPPPSCLTATVPSPSKPRAAELVLQRMQQFKRADPERLKHASEGCSLEAAPEENVPKGPQDVMAANGMKEALSSQQGWCWGKGVRKEPAFSARGGPSAPCSAFATLAREKRVPWVISHLASLRRYHFLFFHFDLLEKFSHSKESEKHITMKSLCPQPRFNKQWTFCHTSFVSINGHYFRTVRKQVTDIMMLHA